MKKNQKKARLAVLVSGNGSNLQAIQEACKTKRLCAEICLVLSNKPHAKALARAQNAGLPNTVINAQHYPEKGRFDTALCVELQRAAPDWIVLAGYMRILTLTFIQAWKGRIINIHPSLLPKYRGLNTHERVLAAQEQEHGCSVHWVVPELDAGPIITQASFNLKASDTVDSAKEKTQQLEHMLYPLSLAWVLSDPTRFHGTTQRLTNQKPNVDHTVQIIKADRLKKLDAQWRQTSKLPNLFD